MHPAERRREQRRKIAAELLERSGYPGERAFLSLKDELLKRAHPGSPEAIALAEVTWNEVRDDISTLSYREPLLTNLVSFRHAANIAGVDFGDFVDAMASRGYRGGMLERKEIRGVLSTLFMRSDDPEAKEQIKAAIHTFADEPEP